jgi:hypothetical protein
MILDAGSHTRPLFVFIFVFILFVIVTLLPPVAGHWSLVADQLSF